MTQEDTNKGQTTEPEQDLTEVNDIETLKQMLVAERKKTEGYLANWQRVQADLINYKRRIEQEKEEIINFANSRLMVNILPALDDFELAFASLSPDNAELDWVNGIRIIERKLRTTLETEGLSEIKAAGEPFDPRFHEAVRQDKGKEGIVIQELHKGYTLHGRVIRPAKVVVGNGHEEEKEED